MCKSQKLSVTWDSLIVKKESPSEVVFDVEIDRGTSF